MSVALITAGVGVLKDVIGVIDQSVEDKDLKLQLMAEQMRQHNEMTIELLRLQTNPFVDGLTKVMYVSRDVMIPLFRPVGSALMSAFGLYLTYKGVLSPEDTVSTETVVAAVSTLALPAWGTSRHLNKQKEQTEITKREHLSAVKELNKKPSEDSIFSH